MFLEVFDNSKRPLRDRVAHAAVRFYARHRFFPNLVYVPVGQKPARIGSVQVLVGDVMIRVTVEEREGLPEKTLYIGLEPEE